MEALELCNSIRKEFEGISESKIPLDALPEKMQDLVLALHREENYSIEYTIASLIMAASSAIGNAVSIRIKGGWTSSPMLYLILVGRPGMGKTPPLDFAFRPIQKRDTEQTRKFMKEKEQYDAAVEGKRGKKDEGIDLPPKPVLRRTLISDFTPEAMMHALNDNQRGIVLYVDEIMGMFNSVNQYNRGQLIEQLLTAFSGKPLNVLRCNMPVPIHIEQPFINIVGTMQTTRVHELIEKGYRDNGLLDRILFVYPSSQKITDWMMDAESASSFNKYAAWWESVINKLLDFPFSMDDTTGNVSQTVLHFSADASRHFIKWRNDAIHAVNAIADDSLVDSRIMKAPMITARIALIIQLLRWACGDTHKDHVDIDSMKAAISLSEYFEGCYTAIQRFILMDGLEPRKKVFQDNVPQHFTTADAVMAGKEAGLSERSVMYALVNLAGDRIIRKLKRGEYEKLQQ